MPTEAKCVTCNRVFTGPREEATRWILYHGILHELQGEMRQRIDALQAQDASMGLLSGARAA